MIVRSDKGIFALYEGDGFTFDAASGVLTLDPILASRIAGTVELTVTLALQLVHRALPAEVGERVATDFERWFGDEQVADGDPVVLQQGGNFVLALGGEDGETVLTYTDDATEAAATNSTKVFWLDSRGNRILQKRGAPIFDFVSGEWVERAAVEGTPVLLVGNEAAIYFGGERVYYTQTEATQDARYVNRLTFDSPNVVVTYTGRTYPTAGPTGSVPTTTTNAVIVTLDDGDNLFTIVDTHEGLTKVNTGAGIDHVAVRSVDGLTNVNTGATTTSSTSAARQVSGAPTSSTCTATATGSGRA